MDAQQIILQLGIDHTFFTLFIVIGVLHLVLSAVYLKPYQRLFERRKEKTVGAEKKAEELMKKANENFDQYQRSLKTAHHDARKLMKQLNAEAVKDEEAILNKAQQSAKEKLQALHQRLEEEKNLAMKSLLKEIPELSREIASKVLGRSLETRG